MFKISRLFSAQNLNLSQSISTYGIQNSFQSFDSFTKLGNNNNKTQKTQVSFKQKCCLCSICRLKDKQDALTKGNVNEFCSQFSDFVESQLQLQEASGLNIPSSIDSGQLYSLINTGPQISSQNILLKSALNKLQVPTILTKSEKNQLLKFVKFIQSETLRIQNNQITRDGKGISATKELQYQKLSRKNYVRAQKSIIIKESIQKQSQKEHIRSWHLPLINFLQNYQRIICQNHTLSAKLQREKITYQRNTQYYQECINFYQDELQRLKQANTQTMMEYNDKIQQLLNYTTKIEIKYVESCQKSAERTNLELKKFEQMKNEMEERQKQLQREIQGYKISEQEDLEQLEYVLEKLEAKNKENKLQQILNIKLTEQLDTLSSKNIQLTRQILTLKKQIETKQSQIQHLGSFCKNLSSIKNQQLEVQRQKYSELRKQHEYLKQKQIEMKKYEQILENKFRDVSEEFLKVKTCLQNLRKYAKKKYEK